MKDINGSSDAEYDTVGASQFQKTGSGGSNQLESKEPPKKAPQNSSQNKNEKKAMKDVKDFSLNDEDDSGMRLSDSDKN